MKTIGFIAEQHRNDKLPGFNTLLTDTTNSIEVINKVVNYLVNGVLVFETFSIDEDITESELKLISRSGFLTDGVWVWPKYYAYYLKKVPNLSIDESFLEYLNDKNFAKINPIEVDIEEANNFLESYLSINTYRSSGAL